MTSLAVSGAPRRSDQRMSARGFVWLGLAVVLAVALAIGASRSGASATSTQRAATIDSALRCPSCEDLSVADSSSASAVEIRRIVLQKVRQGESTTQIETFLESRYGVGILLSPPASGISAAVWVVPLLAVMGGIVGLGVVFWRRRRVVPAQVAGEDRALVEEALALAHAREKGSEGDPLADDGSIERSTTTGGEMR